MNAAIDSDPLPLSTALTRKARHIELKVLGDGEQVGQPHR